MAYHNVTRIAGEPYLSFQARQLGRTVAEHAAVLTDCAYSAFAAGVFNRAELDRDLAHIKAEVEACAEFDEREPDEHVCYRGPVCAGNEYGDCLHWSCEAIIRSDCQACEDNPYVACPKHGFTTVTGSGTSSGYAGGRVAWATLGCGCTEMDESDDVRAAV